MATNNLTVQVWPKYERDGPTEEIGLPRTEQILLQANHVLSLLTNQTKEGADFLLSRRRYYMG